MKLQARVFQAGMLLAATTISMTAMAAPYDTMTARIDTFAKANPGLVTVSDIGKNDQNTAIQVIRIEDPASNVPADRKVKHLVVGVHHGNEQQSAEVAMQFAADIVNVMKTPSAPNYDPLADHVWYVVPVLNISGYNAGSRYETGKSGSGIDANRDYEDVCVVQTKWRLASTRNLDAFMTRENIVGAVTIHGYIGTFTYPWGIYTTAYETKDDAFFHDAAAKAVAANGYQIGTHGDIVYPAAGSFEDWAYYRYGIWAMLLEVRRGASVAKDSQALMTFFAQLPSERSKNNQHTGQCTKTRPVDDEGRPMLARP